MNHDNTKISFEALLQMAVTEADQRDLARLPSNQEMNDAFQPSQRLEKKVEKTLHQRQTARRRRTALRWARNAAVVVLGIWVVFTGALVPVQAVQQAAYSTLLEWKEQFTSLFVSSVSAAVTALPEDIQVTYLPEGYTLEKHIQIDAYLNNFYTNDLTGYLNVQVHLINSEKQIDLDNEYSGYYTITFDDISALWIQNDSSMNVLIYEKDDYLFYLAGSMDISELIKIAQGIKY